MHSDGGGVEPWVTVQFRGTLRGLLPHQFQVEFRVQVFGAFQRTIQLVRLARAALIDHHDVARLADLSQYLAQHHPGFRGRLARPAGEEKHRVRFHRGGCGLGVSHVQPDGAPTGVFVVFWHFQETALG